MVRERLGVSQSTAHKYLTIASLHLPLYITNENNRKGRQGGPFRWSMKPW